MKYVLIAAALIAGTLAPAGSATAGITVPKAYSRQNSLIAFTPANPPHSPHPTAVTDDSHVPRVVVKGGRLVAGQVHAHVVVSAGVSGYLDQAARGVRFTYITTYFNVPSVKNSSDCSGNPADGSAVQVAGIAGPLDGPDNQEAGVAETGCNGATTADFFYNVAGDGAFYYSGVNAGDAIEASITVNSASEYVLQVKDLTTGGLLQVTMACQMSSCPDSTAYVVSQPQNLTGGVMPDFTMINFTGSIVRANFSTCHGNLAANRGKWTSKALEEQSPSTVTPSALQGGQAFSNTWVK